MVNSLKLAAVFFVLLSAGVLAQDTRRSLNADRVRLREGPSEQAAVIRLLPMNATLEIVISIEGTPFCEVTHEGTKGFVACRFLKLPNTLGAKEPAHDRVATPTPTPTPAPAPAPAKVLARAPDAAQAPVPAPAAVSPSAEAPPRGSLALALAAFNANPGYEALFAYARVLQAQRDLSKLAKDPQLERLKAQLAAGVIAAAVPAYPDLSRLSGSALRNAIGARHFSAAADAATLAQAIVLEPVSTSHFQSAADLAPHSDNAERLSGRFKRAHTVQTQPRVRTEDGFSAYGAWDIGGAAVRLKEPVIEHTLFADGRLVSAPSRAARGFFEERENPAAACRDFSPGFAAGDADARIFTANSLGEAARQEALSKNPAGSVLRFYTPSKLPVFKAASLNTESAPLSAASGFSSARISYFDFNADGIFDLAVWHGTGRPAAHAKPVPDQPGQPEDEFHRLVFVNLQGSWRLMGYDSFAYACG